MSNIPWRNRQISERRFSHSKNHCSYSTLLPLSAVYTQQSLRRSNIISRTSTEESGITELPLPNEREKGVKVISFKARNVGQNPSEFTPLPYCLDLRGRELIMHTLGRMKPSLPGVVAVELVYTDIGVSVLSVASCLSLCFFPNLCHAPLTLMHIA